MGKTYRKNVYPYRFNGDRIIHDKDTKNRKASRSCLNHGGCPYCMSNVTHRNKKREPIVEDYFMNLDEQITISHTKFKEYMRDRAIKYIIQLVSDYNTYTDFVSEKVNELRSKGSSDYSSINANAGIFRNYISVVSELVKIPEHDIHWYLFDNKCGAEGLVVTDIETDVENVIDSVESFVDNFLKCGDD